MGLSKRAWIFALVLHILMVCVILKLLWPVRFYSTPTGRVEVHNAYVLIQAPQVLQLRKPSAQKIEIAKNGVLPNSIMQPVLTSPGANSQAHEATAQDTTTPTKIITPAIIQASSQPAVLNAPNIEPLAPNEIQQLLQLISLKIQQHLAYPRIAQTETEQGQSVLQFELTPQGELQNVQVVQSSGMRVLDQAALSAVAASSPISFPADLHLSQPLKLRLPVRFSL